MFLTTNNSESRLCSESGGGKKNLPFSLGRGKNGIVKRGKKNLCCSLDAEESNCNDWLKPKCICNCIIFPNETIEKLSTEQMICSG